MTCPLGILIGYFLARHRKQPGLKSARLRVVLKLAYTFGNRHERFLHDFLGLLMLQSSVESELINQAPIGIEKRTPTLLVFPILEPTQETLASRDQVIRAIVCLKVFGHFQA